MNGRTAMVNPPRATRRVACNAALATVDARPVVVHNQR
jgi:hypothetical protein